MSSKIKIAHQVPGRIRLKVPAAKRHPERLEEYKQAFSLIPGIEQVETSPETASIILKYDPDRQADFQAGFNAQYKRGESAPVRPRPPSNEIDVLATKIQQEAEYLAEHSDAARAFVDFCKNADRQIRVTTDNTLDLKMLLAIGVIGVTVFEVGATAATPVWLTLALFGLNHFLELQSERAEAQAQARAVKASV
jgi:hypothetical protein